ncbi:MAG: hypothetical protein M1822_004070 [Bathelium mastoideum]|nr:MAG: hypothetical protein M1822_004070 [Bathelium mastoideum]
MSDKEENSHSSTEQAPDTSARLAIATGSGKKHDPLGSEMLRRYLEAPPTLVERLANAPPETASSKIEKTESHSLPNVDAEDVKDAYDHRMLPKKDEGNGKEKKQDDGNKTEQQ